MDFGAVIDTIMNFLTSLGIDFDAIAEALGPIIEAIGSIIGG